MARNRKKEGFTDVTDVRVFLYGTRNRKHSKAYLRVKEQDGHYCLSCWLDNRYTPEEIGGDKETLRQLNGFHETAILMMNKAEPDGFLMETLQHVTATAVATASSEEGGYEESELYTECRLWAIEFADTWNGYVKDGTEDTHDYINEIKAFAKAKTEEYIKGNT